MTQSFSTNSNNDIFLSDDGNLSISSGIQAVLYACANAAKAQLNEMIYAYDQGVANFQTIWTNRVNVAQFEASVRSALLSVDGVTGVQSFETRIIGDIITYRAVIDTIYGAQILNG